jgi:phenylacetate-CoA ligase
MRLDQFFFREFVYRPATLMRGQPVISRMRLLEATQWLTPPELTQLQLERLQTVIRSARAHCPAYKKRLRGLPAEVPNLSVLTVVPTLSKQELRNDYAALCSDRAGLLGVRKTTGGSTGEPVTLLKSRAAMAWELAAAWRGYRWAGVGVGDRQARFWGTPLNSLDRVKAHVTDFICHRRRFSAFDFDREHFTDCERRLVAFSPDWLYGYVSMLAEFARWIASEKRTCKVTPRAIVTTAEVLSADDRAVIEHAFHSRVFNEYGCGELGTVAHECPQGRLHTNDENMIVEILDGDRTCGPGEKGEIVVTDLSNTDLPLVRYRTGDFASFSEAPCPCGRTLRTLDRLYGRAYDFIVATSGRKFHAEFLMYVFEEAQRHDVGIAQFQARQESARSLRVLVVPAPQGFSLKSEQALIRRIHELLGDGMHVEINRVDQIERERSGKMRVIVGLTAHDGETPCVSRQP